MSETELTFFDGKEEGYELRFVRRLQRALGYEESDEIVEDRAFSDLTVMCNHAANRIERITHVAMTIRLGNDDLYKDLVYRFIDRMNDPCEDVDPAEKILKEFVAAFEQVVRVEESMTQDDDGGVEGLSEGLDIGDACPECGQVWSGTL